MANIFESAFMTLKNGMTMYFADSKARELIRKLQTAMSLIHEIPAGGTTDQVLKKASNDDFDVEWGAGGGGVANTWYATCSTAAGTAAKVATSATSDFVLATGNMVRVLFSDTNIQTQPTLSVDGSTAKRIKNITTDNNITTNLWRAGEVVDLVYDGTDFIVSDGGLANGTYYGRTKLSNSTSSASQTTAASSKAVKDTYDAIPDPSDAAPQDLGTATAGSSADYSRADHVHNLPTIPSPSSATPQDLGTADAGSSDDYSRSDHVHNLPAIPTDAGIVDLIYPVGSIYMSVNSTSPETLFGGTWQQIEDTFLLSAGQTYTAGDTGGSATMDHTHTMAHTHNLDSNGYAKMLIYTEGSRIAYREKSGCPAWSTTFRTASMGSSAGSYSSSSTWGAELGGRTAGSSAENTGAASNTDNMPPYLVVYVWKRTA